MKRKTMIQAVMMMAMFASPFGAWAQNAGVVATVQSAGQEPVEYTDLEAAFAAAKNGDEVKLLADCTLAADNDQGLLGKLILGNGTDMIDVTLDLNGHTVSGSADELVTVTSNAGLRIIDGGTGGGIVTTGEKAIRSVGALYVNGGTVSGQKYGIYSQGNVAVGGGTVSGGDYGLYVEQGMADISGGTFVATGTDGIGIESVNSNGFYILGLPTFNCTVADISLAQDQKIEFSGDITEAPAKKIRVKVANAAPYMFTTNYASRVWNESTGTFDPEKVFEYYDETAGLSFALDSNGSDGVDVVIAQRYALTGEKVRFFLHLNYVLYPVTMAEEGQTIYVGLDENEIPEGHYFTGAFTSSQATVEPIKDEGLGMPPGFGQFTMPAEAVTVAAAFAEQEEYTIDLTTSTSVVIPEQISLLLSYMKVGNKDCSVYDDGYNWYLDLNVDGVNDVEVKSSFDETTQYYIYSLELLSGENVYATDCHFALNITPPEQYNSLFFKFGAEEPREIEDSWISLAKGPFVYNGKEQKPAVTVTDNGTDIKDYVDITYSHNTNANEANGDDAPTVTVTAKSNQTKYTGSASKTFVIARKRATIKPNNATKIQGMDDPGLTAAVSDVVEGEKLIYTLKRAVGEEVGDYEITVMLGDNPNYIITASVGTFTIKSAIDVSKPIEVSAEEGGAAAGTYYPLSEDVASSIVKTNKKYKAKKVGVRTSLLANATKNGKKLRVKSPKGNPIKATIFIKVGKKTTIKIKANKKMTTARFKELKTILKKQGIKNIKYKELSRAAAGDDVDEDEIESGVEYEVLEDCDLFFDFVSDEDDDEDIELESIMMRLPGDANDDEKVDVADIVEMVNAKEGKPTSENFSLLNADINEDGEGEVDQEDIDETVNLIME